MVKYFHIGTSGKKGGTTLGYEVIEKSADGSMKMLVSFSRCSDAPESNDVFDKKKGRLIAAGRLRIPGKHVLVEKPADMGKYDFLKELVKKNDELAKMSYGQRKHTPGTRKNAQHNQA